MPRINYTIGIVKEKRMNDAVVLSVLEGKLSWSGSEGKTRSLQTVVSFQQKEKNHRKSKAWPPDCVISLFVSNQTVALFSVMMMMSSSHLHPSDEWLLFLERPSLTSVFLGVNHFGKESWKVLYCCLSLDSFISRRSCLSLCLCVLTTDCVKRMRKREIKGRERNNLPSESTKLSIFSLMHSVYISWV